MQCKIEEDHTGQKPSASTYLLRSSLYAALIIGPELGFVRDNFFLDCYFIILINSRRGYVLQLFHSRDFVLVVRVVKRGGKDNKLFADIERVSSLEGRVLMDFTNADLKNIITRRFRLS